MIDFSDGAFFLVDRASEQGTQVNGLTVGGRRTGGRVKLDDQAVITVGSEPATCVFRFAVD